MWLASKQVPREFLLSTLKFKKWHRLKLNKFKNINCWTILHSHKTFQNSFWTLLGCQSVQLTNLQLITVNEMLKAHIKTISQRWRFICWMLRPQYSRTYKPKDTRMGRGKGTPIGSLTFYNKSKNLIKVILPINHRLENMLLSKKLRSQLPLRTKLLSQQW